MFEREMMILEIKKRKEVLTSLIEELEQRSLMDLRDCLTGQKNLDTASRNLKKIGKIKRTCLRVNSAESPQKESGL